MEITKLKITGLTCMACQKLSQKMLMKIEGVENVKVEENGQTLVTAKRKITLQEAQKALESTHYKVCES